VATGRFVSRGGEKLAAALDAFHLNPQALVCADLGSHVGGFVDCLLQRGAARVYAVEPGYGVLDYRLRKDPRVVVCERTNALHYRCPEPCDLVTIDVGWTPQRLILPPTRHYVRADTGRVVTLIKPHYEADPALLNDGVLPEQHRHDVLAQCEQDVAAAGWSVFAVVDSPIAGHGGNLEQLWLLKPA
jgi:23S rRNA (cytidine1920-2'-O)/16S rRNA (cytidine1409-2'-O)-methyltransferase